MGRPLNPLFPDERPKDRHARELQARHTAIATPASSPSDGALEFEPMPAPKKAAEKPAAKKKASKR